MKYLLTTLFYLLISAVPALAGSTGGQEETLPSLITSPLGITALVLFVAAYCLVIFEEKLHLRKSKPVLLAAGIIWVLVAVTFNYLGETHTAQDAIENSHTSHAAVEAAHTVPVPEAVEDIHAEQEAAEHANPVEEAIEDNLLEYAELLLFLLVAMTYINSMEERNVFQCLRIWLVCKGFSLRVVFWITGFLAFIISPVADNLTTALLMGAVAMAVGGNNKKFITLACINIVVGANAGGAFSPFGDITTLMVWQAGIVEFQEFFVLLLPSAVNWLVPAIIMNFAIGKEPPEEVCETVTMKIGAKRIIVLFLLTIVTAVSFHNYLELPAATGMMLGLGYLGFFSYWLKRKEKRMFEYDPILGTGNGSFPRPEGASVSHFDLMRKVSRAEWDTLLFFYGVVLCVGGLSQFGYLAVASDTLYGISTTFANVMVGILSAVVDNIPVMFAVLTAEPKMVHGQWLLVTLTAGVGGSLLSIGSAAGVALMGTARGTYTFGAHLKWTWAIALGYAASILCHLWINASYFKVVGEVIAH